MLPKPKILNIDASSAGARSGKKNKDVIKDLKYDTIV
jgi:hypothetical protein